MKKHPVAVTIRSFGLNVERHKELHETCIIKYINKTGKRLSESELSQHLQGIEGVIAGTEPFTKNVIEFAETLKIISRVGVGLDSVDLEAAHNHGIKVVNTPDAPVHSVAEHTVALILVLLKNFMRYTTMLHDGSYGVEPGHMLSGRTVGIVGMGRIGYRVASLLEPFGCKITYYDPWTRKEIPKRWHSMTSLDDLLKYSDILTLHSPPSPDGRALLDQRAFTVIKNNALIINTARGSLIDETALAKALENGRISGAGLDVQAKEPYTGVLLDFPQVIITPHVASNTVESRQQMEIEAVNNMIKAFGG